MKRTFVTSIALQPKGKLDETFYEPVEFILKNNRKTRFPIIPIVAELGCDKPEDTLIIAIIPCADTADYNYETYFLDEIKSLGLSEDNLMVIHTEPHQGKKASLRLLMDLLSRIPDDTLVYSDITYNTKPMSAMVLYAMRFVEKVKDAEVEGIFYGEIERDRQNKQVGTFLYDITCFKYLSDIADQLEQIGIKDLQGELEKLINE